MLMLHRPLYHRRFRKDGVFLRETVNISSLGILWILSERYQLKLIATIPVPRGQ